MAQGKRLHRRTTKLKAERAGQPLGGNSSHRAEQNPAAALPAARRTARGETARAQRISRLSPGNLPVIFAAVNDPAKQVIQALDLAPLPHEGGFFRVQWISPERDRTGRPAAGLIWFLITPDADGFSALHRVDAPETWTFHAGDPVDHLQLGAATGAPAVLTRLGGSQRAGHTPRLVVPANGWQGARLAASSTENGAPAPHGWALFTCLMQPAWRESGFELGHRASLLRDFPAAADWVQALTRA